MIEVMIDCHALNRTETMGSPMHPAAVMRLHLQRVDERVDEAVLLKEVGVPVNAILAHHRHHVGGVAQASRPLDVGQDLRIVDLLGNPADFRALHGVVQPNPLEIIPIRLLIVGELLRKRPLTNILKRKCRKPEEASKVVVGIHGLGRDCRAASD